MTWADRFRAAAELASAAWRWLALVGAVVLALLLARACNGEHAAAAEVRRLKEAFDLERQGFLVAQRASQDDLEAQAAQIPALKAELERLEKALKKKPRIVNVERVRTTPALAEGTSRPPPDPGALGPDCLFARGDRGDIRIDSVHLETREGNQVAVVAAECWRLMPLPETHILAGVGSAPVSSLLTETPPEKPGWGGGLGGGYGTTGPIGSAIGVTPGDHLLGIGIVSAGPGLFAAQAGIVWRP